MDTLRRIIVAILRWYGLKQPAAAPQPEPPPPPRPLSELPPRSFASPLGYLIRRHVRTIQRDQYELALGPPPPLPPEVRAWLAKMDDTQLRRILNTADWQIQDHVEAGLAGQCHDLGYVVPLRLSSLAEGSDGREGRSGKGGPGRAWEQHVEAIMTEVNARGYGGPRR